MRYRALVGDRQVSVATSDNGHERAIQLEGRDLRVDWRAVGDSASGTQEASATQYSVLIGGHSYEVYVRRVREEAAGEDGGVVFEVMIGGRPFLVSVEDERTQALASLAGGHGSGDAAIRAPMPGLVSNVLAEEGASVERGQALVVLEAMKMENDLAAPRAGVVKSIRVSKGQTVNQGDVLAVVGNPPGEEEA